MESKVTVGPAIESFLVCDALAVFKRNSQLIQV